MSLKDNPEYLESLQLFYSERLKSSLKPKFAKCKGCSKNKQFIVEEGKLYYTCGSSSGNCGQQLKIDLAEYMYYPGVNETNNNLNSLVNKTKHPDIYSEKEIKEYEEFVSDTDKLLKEATKEFIKINKLDERFDLIQKISKDRINMKKEKNLLMDKIKTEVDITKKQNLIKDYIRINQQLQKDYFTMDEQCKDIDNHVLVKNGSAERVKPEDRVKKEDKPAKPKIGEPIDKTLLPELQGLVKGDNNNMVMNVIVAYRDPGDGSRKEQLKVFKEQMNLIFKDQTDIQFYIVEQESTRSDYGALPDLIKQPNSEMAKFNLGLLKNIGFELASKKKSKGKNYYILTDVDLLPSMNLIKEYLKYPKNPIHLANKGTRYNMDGKDASFLGGVISVSDKDFKKANGYPNNFWGWGGEDNALNRRFRDNHIRVEKPKEHVIDLEKLNLKEKLTKLKVDQTKELRKREKLDEDRRTWSQNGLSDIKDKFKITKKLKAKNFTHVKVFLNVESDINLEEEGPTYNPGSPPLIVDEPEDEGPTYSPDSPPLIVDEPEDKPEDKPEDDEEEDEEDDEKDDEKDEFGLRGYMKRKVEGEGVCEELTKIKVSKSKQEEYRKKIYDEISGKILGDLTVKNMKKLLTDELLIEMFELYDKYYFNDKIKDWNGIGKCGWRVCWADKCSVNIFGETALEEKSKGGTTYIKIVINDKAFIKAINNFLENEDETMATAGIECNDILSCIQLTFEHEMIHGIMFCLCRNYMIMDGPGSWHGKFHNQSAHSKTFMTILNNIFGQDDYRSDILSSEKTKQKVKEIMKENAKLFKENKANLKVGDEVIFDGKVNKKITKIKGKISKKNPTNAKITDEKGLTWNVRYNLLMKSE
jgi:hypothetical protein